MSVFIDAFALEFVVLVVLDAFGIVEASTFRGAMVLASRDDTIDGIVRSQPYKTVV